MVGGCATIASREHIVPIDSVPRGLAIYESSQSQTQMGITPFFTVLPRAYRQELAIGIPDNKQRAVEQFTCGINWTTAVIGNGAAGALHGLSGGGPATGLLAFGLYSGIDLLTGNFFSCSDGILFRVKVPQQYQRELKECRVYLVIPPMADDEKISDLLTQRWLDSWQTNLPTCDTIVDPEIAKQRLAFVNLNHTSKVKLANISRKNMDYLGYYTKANHLVILSLTDADQGQTITANAYDMLSLDELDSGKLPWTKVRDQQQISQDSVNEAAKSSFIARSMSFFPNSIAYLPSDTELSNNKLKDKDLHNLDQPVRLQTLPRALAGLSAYSVLHPDGYNDWDLVWSLWPRITSASLDQNQTLFSVTDGVINYRLRGILITPFYEGATTLHTPIGAVSLGLGIGPTIAYISDNFTSGRMQVSYGFNVNITYTAFITKQLFLSIGADAMTFDPKGYPVASAKYFHLDSLNQAWAGIGYFIPELRTKIRNWMNR